MIRSTVLLSDAEDHEFAFEAVAAASLLGGEHHSVVCQCGFGDSVGVDGGAETLEDDGAGDGVMSGEADDVSGMVVEEREDLGVLAVGERPVSEVGLPAFVEQVSLDS